MSTVIGDRYEVLQELGAGGMGTVWLVHDRLRNQSVMHEFTNCYNHARPHQGLDQQIPIPKAIPGTDGIVLCYTVLGGIIHDYFRDVAQLSSRRRRGLWEYVESTGRYPFSVR